MEAREACGGGAPTWPPPALATHLAPAFPPDLGDAAGADLLVCAAFLNDFADVLGLWPFSAADLLAAARAGEASALLGAVHVALLRCVQADAEESHATGATVVRGRGGWFGGRGWRRRWAARVGSCGAGECGAGAGVCGAGVGE